MSGITVESSEIYDESRLVALETKLSYLEDFLNQLQAVTVAHSEQLALLQKENRLIAQKLRDLSDTLEGDIPDRKPPHY